MEKMVAKIIVLREICEAKDTLFGPFSLERTVQMKQKVWDNILDKAKSLGLVSACKDYKYMRDVYWQNMKRHALAKRENEHIHGKEFKRSPIEDLVYEIIDNTSILHQQQPSLKNHQNTILTSAQPAILHHSVMLKTDLDYDFMDEDAQEEVQDIIGKLNNLEESPQMKDEPTEPKETSQPEVSTQNNSSEGSVHDKHKQKLVDVKMKKRKAQLEIEFLELQNYKTQLEVLELECKLGIKPSKFTKGIAKTRKKNKLVFENEDDDSDSQSD